MMRRCRTQRVLGADGIKKMAINVKKFMNGEDKYRVNEALNKGDLNDIRPSYTGIWDTFRRTQGIAAEYKTVRKVKIECKD